jgi:hypothetical protein
LVLGRNAGHRQESVTHVILANEPNAYRETIAAAIRSLRPNVVVSEVTPEDTDCALLGLTPDLVVCSRLTPAVERCARAWVLLYADGSAETVVALHGRRTMRRDISFGQLLEVLDEAESLLSSA